MSFYRGEAGCCAIRVGCRISTKSEEFVSARNSSTAICVLESCQPTPKFGIFLSFSGPVSKMLAAALFGWLEKRPPFVRALHDGQGHFRRQSESAASQVAVEFGRLHRLPHPRVSDFTSETASHNAPRVLAPWVRGSLFR